ncbi:hypothetical protein KI688_008222 [Linnemannia hyalina]|uniref:Uncharacterized protein n=1 Tax=Linnemannia hyalina TaxID=64524 RepID=A0A9P7Y1Q7_9FUNG|nr:hypothetical protein KI688_008222 [Linnemannia hyalina]
MEARTNNNPRSFVSSETISKRSFRVFPAQATRKQTNQKVHTDRYDGWDADLPNEDTAVDCSQNRRSLHWLALHHLKKAKEVSVALSGIWNTFSVAANKAFTPLQLQEVHAFCKVQEMDKKEPEVDDLVKVLAETLETGTLEEVMEKTYDLQVQSPSLRRILHVLQVIIRNIIRSLHGKWNPFEADALHVWSSIFREGLPMDTPVGNIECKKAGSAKVEVASQLRKNLKINKSILLELERYELECPLLLSIHGLSATIFKIVKYKDNWIGAEACDPGEFEHFLSDHLQLREVNRSKFRKKAVEDDEEDQGSQNVMETLEWESVVVHTPTKPAKSKLLEKLKRISE